MGYLHIQNLYKEQDVLLFKQVYALEKLHGSSAHVLWNKGVITFFSGGESHENFIKLFDKEKLIKVFTDEWGVDTEVCIFGEVYGGKCQGMSATYGTIMKFIAFDVQIDGCWLNVPNAYDVVVNKFGLEFVDFALVDATVEALDKERLKESTQAIRNGCGNGKKREGIVIRPVIELIKSNGNRIICKHKNDDFQERKTIQKVVDPGKMEVLSNAEAIANEWVNNIRLEHVLDKIFINGAKPDICKMKDVLSAMVEDVKREAAGEIVESKEVWAAISKKTAQMFKEKVQKI
jgi:hypothetical protein